MKTAAICKSPRLRVKEQKEQELGRNYCTSAKIAAGAVHVVPVDAELAAAYAPEHAGHVAARVTRARAQSDVYDIHVTLFIKQIARAGNQPFQKSNAWHFFRGEIVGRTTLELLVSFLTVANPDAV